MADAARAILKKQGLALPEDSPAFRRLAFALHRAAVEVAETIRDRAQGVWKTEVQATPVIVAPALSPLVAPIARRRRQDGKPDATLSQIVERWAKDRRPRERTLQEFRTAVRRFTESVGAELQARDVTKQHVVKFLDDFALMPRMMPNKLRDKSLPAILKAMEKKPDVPRVSPATVVKQYGILHTLLKTARKYDFADVNAAEDVKPSDPTTNDEKRLPFDSADLKLIFESPLYTGNAGKRKRSTPGDQVIRDAMFWLPLMALYTGARLDELGQLLLTDVKHETGIHYLHLNTLDEGKRLKTGSSRRRVPLHPELVRCGFLRYVEALRRKGARQVFPELHADKNGRWTSAVSKAINRYLDRIGITDPLKVVHSFRHSLKDACRDAEIPEPIHDAITGHSGGGVGRDYGKGEPLRVLAKSVAKISYPVDLKHLHTT
jgi:hypothetical protein